MSNYPDFKNLKRFGLSSSDVIGGATCWKDGEGWHYDGNSGGAPKSAHPIRDVCWRGSITWQWAKKLYSLWVEAAQKGSVTLSFEVT